MKNMSLSFTTEPEDPMDKGYLVEDASNEEQVEFEAAFEEEEEEMGDEKSITSASEFEGDLGELPERMLFGELECLLSLLSRRMLGSSIIFVDAVLLSALGKDTPL
jgi:hypothetical protein